jgi:DUF1365 family protein
VTPALYATSVHHVRQSPVRHAFTYRSTWWLVDLDDLPSYGPLASFRAEDHVGSTSSIRTNIDLLLAEHGLSCDRVLMLCNARVLGHVFNPLSLHWCLTADGSVVAVVAEVHNTYGGRHAYVLQPDVDGRAQTPKEFYVSPFHTVDGSYAMRLPLPGEELCIDLTYSRPGARPFVATVRGTRVPVTLGSVLRCLAVTRLVTLRIRLQGIRLWSRRLPLVPRSPADSRESSSSPLRNKEFVA